MQRNDIILKKGLVFAIIVVFIGSSVTQSLAGNITNISVNKDEKIINDYKIEIQSDNFEKNKNIVTRSARDNELAGYWHFDEGNGSIAYDDSGWYRDGTINGSSWTDGILGSALDFNGVNNSVFTNINIFEDSDFFNGGTLEAWVKAGTTPKKSGIVDIEGVKCVGTETDGYLKCHVNGHDGQTSSFMIYDGMWHHVVMTFYGSTNLTLYVDGQEILYADGISDHWSLGQLDRPIGIGANSFNLHFFDGIIDEVRIYTCALSEEEVRNHYNSYVFVDDDFTSSTPGWGVIRFNSIQDGIDNVLESGTVYVYNGIYYENVVVNKRISLIGENNTNTVIDAGGSGNVVLLTADNVFISNFALRNSGSGTNSGVNIASDYNIISNCTIYDNTRGIYGANIIGNRIEFCNIFNNDIHAIGFAQNVDYTTIESCRLANNVEYAVKTHIPHPLCKKSLFF